MYDHVAHSDEDVSIADAIAHGRFWHEVGEQNEGVKQEQCAYLIKNLNEICPPRIQWHCS